MSEGGPVRIHDRHGSVRGISVVTLWLENTGRGSENQQEQTRTLESLIQGKRRYVRQGCDSPRGVE